MFDLGMIYTVGFTTLLFSFLLWIFFSAENRVGRFFRFFTFIGLGIWVVGLFLFSNETTEFLRIFFRDIFIVSVSSLILISSKGNKIISAALLICSVLFYKAIGYSFIQNTFQHQPTTTILAEDGEIMVYMSGDQSMDPLERELSKYDVSIKYAFQPGTPETTILDEVLLLDFPADQIEHIQEIQEVLNSMPEINYWEPNEVLPLELPPFDQIEKSSKSKLNDPLANQQWMIEALKVEAFHSLLEEQADRQQKVAKVAILDSGIDGQHPDLKDHLVGHTGKDYRDVQGHGTHVAGIVGAVSNNRIGIGSLLPGNSKFIEIQSFKVMNDFGMGTQQNVVAGMIAAADEGADVISMSLGGKATPEREKIYKEAIAYCREKGCIIVTSAGNSNTKATGFSPTNSDHVIVVSAINPEGKKSYFSNILDGIEWGVAAPGQQIMSTFPKRDYKSMNGTSMSAPFVSSLIGIMRAFEPALTDEQAFQLLLENGRKTAEVNKIGPIIQPSATVKDLLNRQNL